VGSGGTYGIVTDDSEIFRLDNLESEVARGGGPDTLWPSLHRLNPGIFQPHNQRFNALGVSVFLVYTEGLILGVC